MKNKKFLVLMLLVISTILFVGCNGGKKDEKYFIKYFVDGIENTTITPNEYKEGDEVVLGYPTISENEEFDGWYKNSDLTGNKVSKITKEDSGNKEFFGKISKKEIIHIYTIKYFVNGVETEFALKQYDEGDKTLLPTPTLKENETWNGWYLKEDLSGDKLTSVDGQNKNLVLYGAIDKQIIIDSELGKALNYSSYQYVYTSLTGDYIFEDTYSFDNGNTYIHNEVFDQYYGLVDGKKTYFVTDENNDFCYVDETHEDFIYYVESLALFDLRLIDATQFEKKDNCYVPLPNYLQELCRLFTGADNGFDSLKLTLENGLLKTIEIEATSSMNNEIVKCSYLLQFSNFNNVKVELPKDAYNMYAPLSNITIDKIYELSEGDAVKTEGQVTGIYGNNFYLSDDKASILVYMGKDGSHRKDIYLGSTISVTAVVGVYNDVVQLSSVTEIERVNKIFNTEPIVLNSCDPQLLESIIHEMVISPTLRVTSIPEIVNNKFTDISFECSDGVNNITIFISKHLDEQIKNKIVDIISTLKVNDTFKVTNGHIGFHKDSFQIVITDATKIEKVVEEVKLVGIITEPQTLTFNYTVTLDEILNAITVKEVYSNNVKVEIAKTEYKVDTNGFTPGVIKNYQFTVTYKDFTTTCKVVVRDASKQDIIKAGVDSNQYLTVKDEMGYVAEENKYYGFNVGLPSIGKPKTLVIPIEFSDCKAPTNIVSDLEKAFFGTSKDTGWESLQSYYQKASYGKLTIEGTVLKPYNTNKTVKEFEQLNRQYQIDYDNYYSGRSDKFPVSPESIMIKGALEQNDPYINYDSYDTNSDGYIDSIYIIYVNDYVRDNDSLWWAFTTENETEYYEYYDNVEADFYVFMSYKFLSDDFHGLNVNYNTETIIHETGHLMGLNDYYDYDPSVGPDGGLGGGDMMHNNVGDHNAYSKVMLGWIDPIIVSGNNLTIDLNSFGKSGDSIFIFKDWKDTFFDEYFVIDFYTPDGLNSASKGEYGLFSIPGIRVYHVDSTLNDKDKCFSIYDVTKANNSDTEHLQIALVEADGRGDILNDNYSDNNDLFKTGMALKNPRWYDGTLSGFTLTVNSIDSIKANITISY